MDYGTLINKLKPALRIATDAAYDECFGSSRYFYTLDLNVHRAFDAFAATLGVSGPDRGNLLKTLRTHCVSYHTDKSTTGLRSLFHTLPDAFNVRGKWVSESCKMYAQID